MINNWSALRSHVLNTERPCWDHEATYCNVSGMHVQRVSASCRKSPLNPPDRPKTPLPGLIMAASSRTQISLEKVQKNQSAAGLEGGLFQSPSIKNDKPDIIDQPFSPSFLKKPQHLADVGWPGCNLRLQTKAKSIQLIKDKMIQRAQRSWTDRVLQRETTVQVLTESWCSEKRDLCKYPGYTLHIYNQSLYFSYICPPTAISLTLHLYSLWPSVSVDQQGCYGGQERGPERSEMWAEDCPIHHKLRDIAEQLNGLLLGFPAGCATSTWFIISPIRSADWESAPIKPDSSPGGGSKLPPPPHFLPRNVTMPPPSPPHTHTHTTAKGFYSLHLWHFGLQQSHKNYRTDVMERIVACLLGSFPAWRHSWMQQHSATKSHHLWGWQMSQPTASGARLHRRGEPPLDQLSLPLICAHFRDKQRLNTLQLQTRGREHQVQFAEHTGFLFPEHVSLRSVASLRWHHQQLNNMIQCVITVAICYSEIYFIWLYVWP